MPFLAATDFEWDDHADIFPKLRKKLPAVDCGWAALIADLDERGLLDSTLVIVMGEFGRTPKINSMKGRDHWPNAFSVLLAGGGVKGGRVIDRNLVLVLLARFGNPPVDCRRPRHLLRLGVIGLLGNFRVFTRGEQPRKRTGILRERQPPMRTCDVKRFRRLCGTLERAHIQRLERELKALLSLT